MFSPADDVYYIARYEEPMRDKNETVIFIGDCVKYMETQYSVSAITYSKNGRPSRISITDTDGNITEGVNKCDIEKIAQ